MIKTTITTFSLFAASCAFAALTETESEFKSNRTDPDTGAALTANGWTISGSGSASEIGAGAQDTTAILFEDATIDFDSIGTTIKVGEGAQFQSSNDFSIGTKGNVVLNFKSGSTASLITSAGLATSADKAQSAGKVVINVEKGYAGTITLPVIGVVKGNLEMNLHNAYALKDTRLYISNVAKLNMSADQSIVWDIRRKDLAVFQLNITNGAGLFVSKIYSAGGTYDGAKVKLTGENLLDGFIYFVSSMVDSYDDDAKTITLKRGSRLYTISFVDKDGNDVNSENYAGFEFGETVINGVAYHYATMAAIPEPATWAAIFGAIALGLAVYRRRK